MKNSFFICIAIVLFSCNSMKKSNNVTASKNNLFTELFSSDQQGRDEEENVIVQNQADLEALFQSVGQETSPSIDFNKNQVVAIFVGTKNSGGYKVAVEKVVEQEGKIVVYKKIQGPENGSMATMALTYPYTIVAVHSKKEIIFK